MSDKARIDITTDDGLIFTMTYKDESVDFDDAEWQRTRTKMLACGDIELVTFIQLIDRWLVLLREIQEVKDGQAEN